MFGAAAACRDKHQFSAVRAEAPPRGGSQNSPRGLRHEDNTAPTEAELVKQRALFLNEANAACGAASPATAEARASALGGCGPRDSANCKTAKKQRSNNRKQTTIPNPPAPLRRQRTAESTNHADKSRDPCHSGCEVAVSKVKMKG